MRRTQMTTWMPRSARGAIGGLLALGLLALGPVPSQAGDDTAAPITLPTVTHAGKAPKDALRVQVTKDGVITLGDDATPLGAATLRRALAEKAARPELPSAASSTDLILEVDAELPWSLATWVLQIAADPQVRICRTWFAVRVPSGERGALAVFLPTDRGLRPGPIVQPTFSKRKVVVLARPTGTATSLDALYSTLLDRPAAARADMVVELVSPPPSSGRTPTGFMVRVLDVILRAGAGAVTLEGSASRPGLDDPAVWTQVAKELREGTCVPVVRVDRGAELGADLPAGAPRLGVVGLADGPVGSDWGALGLHAKELASLMLDEELEEEIIEEAVPEEAR
ncbi:MAG: hypothetical protein H6806_07165 [Planctomycetes bacterium]|nr:hypothetical protein [Planctomycetota bacterium]MCB9825447.1 hypothetical protein [Planctomycetota bacterium]MCB9829524.1 hypothetical protein [Planctomycetota bacterium]MCB9900541.1 hypothetical protein [Planctomycetota bacterium]